MVNIEWFQRYNFKDKRDVGYNTKIIKQIENNEKKSSWLDYPVTYSKKQKREQIKNINTHRLIGKSQRFFVKIVSSWDTAFKAKEIHDPTACTIWGVTNDNLYYLLWVVNKRMEYPELLKEAQRVHDKNIEMYKMLNSQVVMLVEDKGSGTSLIQDLKRKTKIPVIGINPKGDKTLRFSACTPVIESGRVFLPEQALWLVDYESQLCQFPLGRNDDLVDSTSQFLNWVDKPRFVKNKNLKYWK